MAETAKILNPDKPVLLPDLEAGCSLEQSGPAEQLKAYQEAHPGIYTIAYINCSAAVKALSDVICTSGNAVKIVESAPEDRDLLFVPDENLGAWVMEQPHGLWKGNCYAHVNSPLTVFWPSGKNTGCPSVAHPECTRAVRMLADEICSTENVHFAEAAKPVPSWPLKWVCFIGWRRMPDKQFIPAPTDHCACNECRYMKMNTLEKLHACTREGIPRSPCPQNCFRKLRADRARSIGLSRS